MPTYRLYTRVARVSVGLALVLSSYVAQEAA